MSLTTLGQPDFHGSAPSDMLAGGVYNPEICLEGWTATSFVLMTTALLFYHMTRSKSIEMDDKIAGIFAVAMMILSVVFEIQALVVYVQRVNRLKSWGNNASINQEIMIGRSLTVTIGILIVVQLCIGITILHGAFRKGGLK